jgi:hypothetical protein
MAVTNGTNGRIKEEDQNMPLVAPDPPPVFTKSTDLSDSLSIKTPLDTPVAMDISS